MSMKIDPKLPARNPNLRVHVINTPVEEGKYILISELTRITSSVNFTDIVRTYWDGGSNDSIIIIANLLSKEIIKAGFIGVKMDFLHGSNELVEIILHR